MKRETQPTRSNWRETMNSYGFDIHHFGSEVWWAEDTSYRFTLAEADAIEAATAELHRLCLDAVDRIVGNYRKGDDRLIRHFGIPEPFLPQVAESWEKQEPHVYGRFDLQYDGTGVPKMLEYNADTPTSLFEGAVVQWRWLEEARPEADQFNRIHEALVRRWGEAVPADSGTVHFFGYSNVREDLICYEYLRDTAAQAGLKTKGLDIRSIVWDGESKTFIDPEGEAITRAFKLYPWEYMVKDEYAAYIYERSTLWFEPLWKMLLSNKAILPVLWELNPGHPNLLHSSFSADDFAGKNHVAKPKLSREGANIKVVLNGDTAQVTDGTYDLSDAIYQEFAPLPEFDGYRAVIGSWVVGDEACGMGVREDKGYVTTDDSRFAPHYIAD